MSLIVGNKYAKEGKIKEAIAEYQKIRSDSPLFQTSQFNIARLLKTDENVLLEKPEQSTIIEKPEQSKIITSSWSAIITMWKRYDYLEEQLQAIRAQSVPPIEIIIILNENHIQPEKIRKIAGMDIKILQSDINSLYSRWAISYIAEGEYVSVFDDDIIPGKYWIANAMRACSKYNALVGPSGRIYHPKGKHDYFQFVNPKANNDQISEISCTETDIYCDWVCNSYFFKREWVGYALGDKRYNDSYKTFDDIQLATALFVHGGIKCVTPMQPTYDIDLHGSIRTDYGNDAHAVWKTNSDHHFNSRKSYVESLIKEGYIPIHERENLNKIHLIVPFGERNKLERCLLSIKGQVYDNYTCTLIDDCGDGKDALYLFEKLELKNKNFRYIKTLKKHYPLKAREIATDLLDANPADIIIHIDGDDWLSSPDVLQTIDNIYRNGKTLITYGNLINHKDVFKKPLDKFEPNNMSKRWNVSQDLPQSEILTVGPIKETDTNQGDWKTAPWFSLHLRSFKYSKWLEHTRECFFNKDKEYLRVATDAAILIPMLNNTNYTQINFVPDVMYVYQNGANTIHSKKEISNDTKLEALKTIDKSKMEKNITNIRNFLKGSTQFSTLSDVQILNDNLQNKLFTNSSNSTKQNNANHSVITIVTPNYITDGMLSLNSYQRNLKTTCTKYLFISTTQEDDIKICNSILADTSITPIFPNNLIHTEHYSKELEKKYNLNSDEYRWAMKSIVLIELLNRGDSFALFLDPDMYTVSDITQHHQDMINYSISVFPHFRDPDHEYLRKVLYKDGFFNGGMLSATHEGIPHLITLYKRCLKEMSKDPERQLWDDQKYFDFFVLEVNNLYINKHRGMDYNYWNYEPVEGMVAPSQRSYLLKSGYFIKNWHMSTTLIKNTIEITENKFEIYKPIIAIYLMTLLYFNMLIIFSIKKKVSLITEDTLGLKMREDSHLLKLKELIPTSKINEIEKLIKLRNQYDTKEETFVKEWTLSVLNSICYDNFSILANALTENCSMDVQDYKDKLLLQDLRYITNKILASTDFTPKEIQETVEKMDIEQSIFRQVNLLENIII